MIRGALPTWARWPSYFEVVFWWDHTPRWGLEFHWAPRVTFAVVRYS